MDPRMDRVKEYATYIHNHWIIPRTEHKAAIVSLERRGIFFEETDYISEAKSMISSAFSGNSPSGTLEDTGLKLRYSQLKEIIKSVKPYGIAIIIAMANREDCDELFCSYLPDFSINPINLTYCGIARRLIDEYISKDEVEKLCNKIPNYEGILRNLRTSKERQGKRTPRETPLHCSH